MSIRLSVGCLILPALTGLAILVGCNRDCIDCPGDEPSTVGNYTGIYRYTEIQNGVDTVVDTTQLIEFAFRTGEYRMDMDGSIPESLRVFCDVKGEYELGNGVEMVITDSNYTGGTCIKSWGFGGYFGLDQTTDTMRLYQDQVDSLGVRRVRDLRMVNTD